MRWLSAQTVTKIVSRNVLESTGHVGYIGPCHRMSHGALLPDVGSGLVGACLVPRYCTGHSLLRGSSVHQGLSADLWNFMKDFFSMLSAV